MAANRISLALLLVLGSAVGYCAAQDYDFMYLVLQWPGSYCDTKQSCCYPKSGKPAADFGIHGLWPNRDDGSYPQNCNPDAEFDPSKVRFLPSFNFVSICTCCLFVAVFLPSHAFCCRFSCASLCCFTGCSTVSNRESKILVHLS
jgi:hypothetical protein